MTIDDDNIFDKERRFEIFVPSPKARINLGAPNLKETDEGPFGYTGLSLQSDVHLFIDANKHTLFQTGQNYCGQVGGKWLQYSNADMILSSTANVNLSADKKIVIAAGAGQGQITAKDHGTFPRVVAYNALDLHYRVDRIQTSLFEFFHGRRKHKPRSALAKAGGIDEPYFDADSPSNVELQTLAGLDGGFLPVTSVSLRELLPHGAGKARALTKIGADIDAGGDPVEWLDPVFLSKVAKGAHDPKSLWYGFSPYFARLDPYARIDRAKITNPLANGIAKFKNFLAAMRRFSDVSLKFATAILSLPLLKQAQTAMEAVDNLAKATWHAYHLTDDVFGYWLPNRSSDGTGGRNTPFVGGFVDESKSGVEARVGNLASSKKATIVSAKEPNPDNGEKGWDLVSGTTYKMTIESDQGTVTDAVVVAATPQPASLQITAPALSANPENKRIAFQVGAHPIQTVDLTPANTASVGGFAAALGAALGARASAVESASGGTVTVTGVADVSINQPMPAPPPVTDPPTPIAPLALSINGSAVTVELTAADLATEAAFLAAVTGAVGSATVSLNPAVGATPASVDVQPPVPVITLVSQNDTDALLGRMGVGATATENASSTMDLAPPHLSSTGEQQELALTIDGTTIRVQLSSSTTLRAALDAIPQVALLSTVSGSGNAVTVTSKINGLASNVAASVVSTTGWVFSPDPPDAHGVDGAGPKLTLDELIALIPGLTGASASKAVDTLVLEAETGAAAGVTSKIKATGNLAKLVFGSDPKQEEITGDQTTSASPPTTVEDDYKKLISWNHELQKLPEDTRNLTRPVTNAISDAVAAVSALEAAVESAVSIVGGGVLKGLPQPPESIGLVAKEGITLGTSDRIVGAGGKGVVFIADGGSGTENHVKFIPKIEKVIAGLMAWDPIDKAWDDAIADPADPAKDKPPSLGFRVYSDSAADLYGTYSAQLLALGRGKLKAATPDGKTVVGVGTARVMGSHAVEIAGYRRVVIDARNKGSNDTDGGRVDVLGQTIFVGGFNYTGKAMKDFESTAAMGAGLEPLDLHHLAGAEHLDAATKANLGKTVKNLGWTKELRDKHGPTNFVRIHAAKETTAVVGGFLLYMDQADGVMVGSRKDEADPATNEIDEDFPHLVVDGEQVLLRQKADMATLHLTDKSSLLTFGKDQPYLQLDKNQATMQMGDGKASLSLSKKAALLKHGSSKVHLHASGINVKASGEIKLAGSKVTIG